MDALVCESVRNRVLARYAGLFQRAAQPPVLSAPVAAALSAFNNAQEKKHAATEAERLRCRLRSASRPVTFPSTAPFELTTYTGAAIPPLSVVYIDCNAASGGSAADAVSAAVAAVVSADHIADDAAARAAVSAAAARRAATAVRAIVQKKAKVPAPSQGEGRG